MKRLLLIDGSSLLHRAFYALPLLSTNQGEYTNGVYGFIRMLNKTLQDVKPDYAVICFDKSRVTFRNRIFDGYKGQRKETPNELRSQFQLIKEVLDAMNLSWRELEDYEADDLLGTFDKAAERDGIETMIYSGDRDILQLVDSNTHVYLTKTGISNLEEWKEATIKNKYGLTPAQLIDLKGLMGDTSDNIIGVPGIGEKTALKLLEQFGSIELLYENLEQVGNAKLRQKLADNRELAETSKELATICTKAPLLIIWDELTVKEPDYKQLEEVYRRLEFKALIKNLETKKPASVRQPEDAPWGLGGDELPWQGELFTGSDEQIDYLSLQDETNLKQLLSDIKSGDCLAVSLKWQGRPIEGKIEALGLAVDNGGCFTLTAADHGFTDRLNALKPLLENRDIIKLTAGSKEAILLFLAHDIRLAGIEEDIFLSAYLLDPSATSYTVENLALAYGMKSKKSFDLAGLAAAEAAAIFTLAKEMHNKLEAAGMNRLYDEVELPLAAVLAYMEAAGIRIEKEKLKEMSQDLKVALDQLSEEIYRFAGQEFNINSSKQLAEILFEKMNIPPVKKTKTGYSTDAEVLEQLAGGYEIAAKLLDYRSYSKLKSTYTESLAELINPRTGKLHTTFNQTVTNTGRLSSTDPNLQNIPVRLELGRKVRQVFVPSTPQGWLISGDYNQIELRILAHISKDEKLIKAFLDGEDIHTRTAAEVFGVEIHEVDSAMRRSAKAVNFGIVYGISDYGLSRDLGISRNQAADYIKKYFERYPKVQQYQKETIAKGEKDGFVSTLLGRRRYLADLNNKNFNLRSFAQRMAINTPIQGSAADIIKIAMVNIDKALREQGFLSKMILQVHDELIFDVVNEEKDRLLELIRDLMEAAFPMTVPLTVDLKTGKDWYHMQKV